MRNLFISCISLILLSNFITFSANAQPNNAVLSSKTGQQGPSQSNSDVEIGGTGSPDFYNYWDPNTQSEVWGVRTPIKPEQQTPAPPIYVTPELKWPYPQENVPVPHGTTGTQQNSSATQSITK